MRLSKRVYLTLSGDHGCSLSHSRDCNAYAVRCGEQIVLIDSGVGVESERVIQELRNDGLDPATVTTLLLTHTHLDHAGGAKWLRDALGLRVVASATGARALESADENAISLGAAKRAGIYPPDFPFPACPVDLVLAEETVWEVGDCRIRALPTPGHSGDMVSYVIESPEGLLAFTGDTVFHGGRVIVQCTHDCEPAPYAQSLRLLAGLPIDGLYPGHGIWSVARGAEQVRQALPWLDRLLMPPNAL